MTARLLFVVGLQKSGTTLLTRLLEATPFVARVDRGEGGAFWGNEPPFSPTASPAGVLYQSFNGQRGHELSAVDASPAIAEELCSRLPQTDRPLLFNKSPYNTVRLRWLRTLFPEAFIVAMVRRPVPNVYSLMKKYTAHEGRGRAPEAGWWGVKPEGWADLVRENIVDQCARQWRAVNAVLVRDHEALDMVIDYAALCRVPEATVRSVLDAALGANAELDAPFPALRCTDGEYQTGGALRSLNRHFRDTGNLDTPASSEAIELPPLTAEQIAAIESETNEVAQQLGVAESC